jgi:anti-sigma factor RsiW
MAAHPDDLDLYVMDQLSAERRAEVEAHVDACAECAAELARQARLELQLQELAQTKAEPATVLPLRRRRRVVWAAAGLLAAAGLALVVGSRLHAPAPASEPIVITCPADEHARACLDNARVHGLYVRYPQRRPVPIYESPNLAGGVIAGL